ncbi:MAG: hypothetical protein ACJ76B_05705 [Solirubrobacterales bacterium]
MPDDEHIHRDLLAIYSRLGVIEGKVNVLTRVDRDRHKEELEGIIAKQPLIGQIYLLLDGKRTQTEILEALQRNDIETSAMSVSRLLRDMETEHGMTRLVKGGRTKVYGREPEMAKLLNLTANVTTWLEGAGKIVPDKPKRRQRKAK